MSQPTNRGSNDSSNRHSTWSAFVAANPGQGLPFMRPGGDFGHEAMSSYGTAGSRAFRSFVNMGTRFPGGQGIVWLCQNYSNSSGDVDF